jgi:large subunit ribosomal protein L2
MFKIGRTKLTKYKPLLKSSIGILRKGGRNNLGRITVRHQGGGVKQKYRILDFKRVFKNGIVTNFEYDPNRSAFLAKLISIDEDTKTTHHSYILASKGLKIFEVLQTVESKRLNLFLRPGDCSILSNFEIGDFVNTVEAIKGQGGIYARSAGTFCQILESTASYVKLRLPSGSQRLFSPQLKATLGILARENYNLQNLEKAGRSRWLNRRPSVRGVAMNPIDHPHGGGQGKTKGGRPSVTPQSKPTKGQPTRNPRKKNNLILTSRKKK